MRVIFEEESGEMAVLNLDKADLILAGKAALVIGRVYISFENGVSPVDVLKRILHSLESYKETLVIKETIKDIRYLVGDVSDGAICDGRNGYPLVQRRGGKKYFNR